MPDFVPTTLDVIAPLLVSRIQNANLFADPSLVYPSDDPDDDSCYYAPASQYMTVVMGGAVRADAWEGPVRAFLHINQELICVVWTRLGTDIAGRATHMQGDALGILKKVGQVINVLHGWQVTDGAGNLYSTQPIVYEREDRETRKRNNEEWSRRRVYLSMYYQCATPLPSVTNGLS